MANPHRKPMHFRARSDRAGAKIIGPITVLAGLWFFRQFDVGGIIGGLILIYVGLVVFPATRMFVTAGILGFTKWRAYGARLLWMFGGVLGVIIGFST